MKATLGDEWRLLQTACPIDYWLGAHPGSDVVSDADSRLPSELPRRYFPTTRMRERV